MIAIKFKKVGKKHQASFRIVVAEKRSKLQGNFIEDLGWFNPRSDEYRIEKERAAYWLSVGAQPTPTVWNLMVRVGAARGKKIPVHGKPKSKGGPPEAVTPTPAPVAEAPAA